MKTINIKELKKKKKDFESYLNFVNDYLKKYDPKEDTTLMQVHSDILQDMGRTLLRMKAHFQFILEKEEPEGEKERILKDLIKHTEKVFNNYPNSLKDLIKDIELDYDINLHRPGFRSPTEKEKKLWKNLIKDL